MKSNLNFAKVIGLALLLGSNMAMAMATEGQLTKVSRQEAAQKEKYVHLKDLKAGGPIAFGFSRDVELLKGRKTSEGDSSIYGIHLVITEKPDYDKVHRGEPLYSTRDFKVYPLNRTDLEGSSTWEDLPMKPVLTTSKTKPLFGDHCTITYMASKDTQQKSFNIRTQDSWTLRYMDKQKNPSNKATILSYNYLETFQLSAESGAKALLTCEDSCFIFNARKCENTLGKKSEQVLNLLGVQLPEKKEYVYKTKPSSDSETSSVQSNQ